MFYANGPWSTVTSKAQAIFGAMTFSQMTQSISDAQRKELIDNDLLNGAIQLLC
jgi:hypothetical protein